MDAAGRLVDHAGAPGQVEVAPEGQRLAADHGGDDLGPEALADEGGDLQRGHRVVG